MKTMSIYTINLKDDQDVKYKSFKYPSGESQVRIMEGEISRILEADTVLVFADGYKLDVMELALLTDAIDGIDGNITRSLVLKYLPYSRADRRFTQGDCFGLKSFGNIIDSLGYEEVITFDVHSKRAKRWVSNLTDMPTNVFEIGKILDEHVYTLLLPDKGAVERYQKQFKNLAYCEKQRDPITGEIKGIKVPHEKLLSTENILIIDDICDGGKTFEVIADEIFKNQTQLHVLYLYVTHGIFSKGTIELLKRYKQIFTTDSIRKEPMEGVTIFETNELVMNYVLQREAKKLK